MAIVAFNRAVRGRAPHLCLDDIGGVAGTSTARAHYGRVPAFASKPGFNPGSLWATANAVKGKAKASA